MKLSDRTEEEEEEVEEGAPFSNPRCGDVTQAVSKGTQR